MRGRFDRVTQRLSRNGAGVHQTPPLPAAPVDEMPRRVECAVLVGPANPLRDAVLAALTAARIDVQQVDRGDDLTEPIEGADAVVVVDVHTPAMVTHYEATLRAIASVILRSGRRPPVLSVTYVPATGRDAYVEKLARAENDLRQAGVHVLALRPTLIVGTPSTPAPEERALFARPALLALRATPTLYLPRTGEQAVTPVSIDDVVALVLLGIEHPEQTPDDAITVAGPEQLTVDTLFRKLNGADQRLAYWPARVLPRSKRFIPRAGAQVIPPAVEICGHEMHDVGAAWDEGAVAVRNRSWRGRLSVPSTFWYRVKGSLAIGVPFLSLVGLFAVVVGVHDYIVVRELTSRMTSALLVVLGLFILASAVIALVTRWPKRPAAAFLAGALTALLGFTLFVTTLQNHDPTPLMAVWAVMLVGGIGTMFTTIRRAGPQLLTALRTGKFKFVTSIVSVGALIGLGQWWYTTMYVPASAIPVVNMTSKVTKAGEADGQVVLDGTVTMTNAGDHPATVVASQYEVQMATYESREPAEAGEELRARVEDSIGVGFALSQTSVPTSVELAQVGTPLETEFVLGAGETVTRSFTARVPEEADSAFMTVALVAARRKFTLDHDVVFEGEGADELATPQGKFDVKDDGTSAKRVLPMDEPSWLADLTRGDREFHITQSFVPAGLEKGCGFISAHLRVYVDRKDRPLDHPENPGCDEYHEALGNYYGLAITNSEFELNLADRP